MSATESPLLMAAEQKIQGQLTAQNRDNYMKIVVAGMHAALAKGPDGIMGSLRNSKDPIGDCAKGAVSLVLILRSQAHGVMPLKAMVPAGMTLMLKALDFVDKTGVAKVGTAELDKAARIFTDTIFARMGVSKEMLQHAAVKVHGLLGDPAAMEKIKLQAGTAARPGAAPAPGAQ